MKLNEETAERILKLMRMCHPDEKGEPYTRWDLINEVERRNLALLKALGWNTNLNAIWKNRYTAHEETFLNLLNKWRSPNRKESLFHELPFIIENWTPKEHWTDKDCMEEYNPKSKLNAWLK